MTFQGDITMEMAKVTSKGQITIPVSIRRRLQIKEGDKLLFINNAEGVVMVNPDMLGGAKTPGIYEEDSNIPEKTPDKDTSAAVSTITEEETDGVAAVDSSKPAVTEPATAPAASPVTDEKPPRVLNQRPVSEIPVKPDSGKKGLDISALLDEIRTIGSNI